MYPHHKIHVYSEHKYFLKIQFDKKTLILFTYHFRKILASEEHEILTKDEISYPIGIDDFDYCIF